MTLSSISDHLTQYATRYAWLVIALFVISKLGRLDYPFYWDEAWVYAPAIQAMSEAGPSLLPGVIDESLGRGHPLLFHFLGGVWVKMFGNSLIALHGFALMVSVGLLAAFFYGLRALVHPLAALSSMTVFTFLKVFHVQSIFVLPEVMVALWAWGCVYFFARQRWGPLFVSASLLILTKESGLAIIATLIGVELLLALNRRQWTRTRLMTVGSLVLSVVPYVLFLLYQKQVHGWYFFPEHTGYLDFDLTRLLNQIGGIGRNMFHLHDLTYLSMGLVLAVGALVRRKPLAPWLRVSLCVQCLLFLLVFASGETTVSAFVLRIATVGFFLLLGVNVLLAPLNQCTKPLSRLLVAALFCIFNFLLFSSANFFSYRYLLVIFPLAVMLPFALAHATEVKPWLYPIAALVGLVIFAPKLPSNQEIYDTEPGYIHAVKANQDMVDYFERHVPREARIRAPFLAGVALKEPRSGYVQGEPFTNLVWDDYEYLVTVNGEFADEASHQGLIQDTLIQRPGMRIGIFHRGN